MSCNNNRVTYAHRYRVLFHVFFCKTAVSCLKSLVAKQLDWQQETLVKLLSMRKVAGRKIKRKTRDPERPICSNGSVVAA